MAARCSRAVQTPVGNRGLHFLKLSCAKSKAIELRRLQLCGHGGRHVKINRIEEVEGSVNGGVFELRTEGVALVAEADHQ